MSDGWRALNAAIDEARSLIAAEAPDRALLEEGEAYVSRLVAAGMAGAFLSPLLQQAGLTRALPVHGGPNPDYIMWHTQIDTDVHYRLEGRMNGSERVGVGLYTIKPNGGLAIAAYTAFDLASCASDGSFILDMAADANTKVGLAIPEGARILLVRVLHRDQSVPAQLRLSGGPERTGPLPIANHDNQSLAFVAEGLSKNVREYLKWTVTAQEISNRLEAAPAQLVEAVQGDPDTQYFLGGFDLGSDQKLEVAMPAGLTGYWSLHAYNFWFEHLQTPGVHDRNAMPDAGGKVRIAIGSALPSDELSRINTFGRQKGALICRIVGMDSVVGPPETRLMRNR